MSENITRKAESEVFSLSKEQVQSIKNEELLRKQIRDEISPPKDKEKKLIGFLNSPFGLLLISGIIVTTLGQIITEKINDQKKYQQINKEAIKYISELDERIFQMRFFLTKMDTASTHDSKRYFATGAAAVKLGAEQWYNPIFSDFKSVSIQGLIYWLKINHGKYSETEDVLTSIQSLNVDDSGVYNFKEASVCLEKLEKFKKEMESNLKN